MEIASIVRRTILDLEFGVLEFAFIWPGSCSPALLS